MVLSHKHYVRPLFVLLRHVHSHSVEPYNHYKTLGLTPSATKAEIKAAYYELSKKHHPDRNKGSDESARIFKIVREAYEILGNEHKRMTYDKERVFQFVRRPAQSYPPDNNPDYKDDAERIHFQSKTRTPFRRYSYGKTAYYDFDTWYDYHYGEQAKNEFNFRKPKVFKQNFDHETEEKENELVSRVRCVMIFFFFIMCILSSISLFSSVKKKR